MTPPDQQPRNEAATLPVEPSAVSDEEWMREFRMRSAIERIPLSGTLELTSRCNLKCVHCYLGPQEEQRKKRDLEMNTDQVKATIDQIVASGCLSLTITGGDPMVRKDFPEIYRHAREQGLIVTIFCDGILVTDRIVELFTELPPHLVEVSVYGATAETYEAVTRIKGSFRRFHQGIQRLSENNIPYSLKTVIMTVNQHEVADMSRMASGLGVKFRTDSAIFPCLPTNDHEPLDLRVEPEKAVEIELEDPQSLERWVDYIEQKQGIPQSEMLYQCGAGVTSFYLDPLGYASPCLMTTNYRYSLEEKSFEDLWSDELVQLRSKKPTNSEYECNTCETKLACTGCPAFNYQENGREDQKSDYVCRTTKKRWSRIQDALLERKRLGELPAVARRVARRRAAAAPAAEPVAIKNSPLTIL